MARQVPKNSTPVHNDIISALCCVKLSSSEINIIFAIVKKTYGWDKKMDWISLSQLEALTGIASRHCCSYVNKLVAKKVVLKIKGKIGLNKRTKEWTLHKRGVQELGVQEPGRKLQELGKKLQELGDTKETITKETIQNKKIYKKNYDNLGEFKNIKLTKEEQAKLRNRYSSQETENAITEMSIWLKQNNKTYKDYYAALLGWIKRSKEKTTPTKPVPKYLTYKDL